jgi:phage protein D
MRPSFRILADQQDITDTIRDRLLSLRITDEAGNQPDTVELQLDDRDAQIQWPSHGAELEISLGTAQNQLTRMGLYIIDDIEHSGPPNTITIRGKAADMLASIKAPKTRSWDGITLGALVQTIAGEHGLSAKISEQLALIAIEHIDQSNESDLHLLTRLARQHGAVSKPVAGFLVFVFKGEAKSATGQQLPLVEIPKHQISRHRMTQAERGKYQSVKAYWHDNDTAEKQSVLVGDGDPVFAIRHTYNDAQEATRAASAKLQSLLRGTATLSLTLLGRPELQAEGKLRIAGIRDPVDGEWVINRVEHQLDSSGLQTRCDAEVPNN